MGEETKSVLIMAGGTGGHVYPALTVAKALHEQGYQVSWLGTSTGIEARLLPKTDYRFYTINISGARRNGWRRMLAMPWQLLQSFIQSWKVFSQVKPKFVLGMGGYVSGPGAVVAWLRRIPIIIHEQNAVPGLTNRIVNKIAARTLESFPNAFSQAKHVVYTGNPIREDIIAIPAPQLRLGQRKTKRLLVLGGSQGAMSLNQTVPMAMTSEMQADGFEIWHQTGAKHYEDVKKCYEAHHIQARVDAFIDDMAEAYAWADCVVARAGATTVTELSAAGVGSILIPYPHAVDDHQSKNAQFLERQQAAIVIPQSEFDAEKLNSQLLELFQDRQHLLAMASAASAAFKAQATEQILEQCLGVYGDKR